MDTVANSGMINSSKPNPGIYARCIHAILSKAGEIEAEEDEALAAELKGYAGYYQGEVMKSTSYVGTWGDKLMMMGLPANEPGEFSTYRRVDKDHFVRMRFIRNEDGDVVQMKYYDNYITDKITMD